MTGRVDHDLLDRLAAGLARSWAGYDPGRASCTGSGHPRLRRTRTDTATPAAAPDAGDADEDRGR